LFGVKDVLNYLSPVCTYGLNVILNQSVPVIIHIHEILIDQVKQLPAVLSACFDLWDAYLAKYSHGRNGSPVQDWSGQFCSIV
jgi:hypothetical protein